MKFETLYSDAVLMTKDEATWPKEGEVVLLLVNPEAILVETVRGAKQREGGPKVSSRVAPRIVPALLEFIEDGFMSKRPIGWKILGVDMSEALHSVINCVVPLVVGMRYIRVTE